MRVHGVSKYKLSALNLNFDRYENLDPVYTLGYKQFNVSSVPMHSYTLNGLRHLRSRDLQSRMNSKERTASLYNLLY